MTTKASPFRHFCQGKNDTSPIPSQERWRQERSYVISTEGAAATERRNLLDKMHRSQIPPLASLGRDDKRGAAAQARKGRAAKAASLIYLT